MFEVELPVRFADVDHAGIVYYPRYFHYFHVAFEEFWRQRMGARAYVELLDRDKLGFPAVHAECDYRAPLRFGDTAAVQLTLTAEGQTSLHFRYRVYRLPEAAGAPAEVRDTIEMRTLCAEGKVVCAVVDLAEFTAVALPAALRDVLATLAPEPAA